MTPEKYAEIKQTLPEHLAEDLDDLVGDDIFTVSVIDALSTLYDKAKAEATRCEDLGACHAAFLAIAKASKEV